MTLKWPGLSRLNFANDYGTKKPGCPGFGFYSFTDVLKTEIPYCSWSFGGEAFQSR